MRIDVFTLFPEWFDWMRRPRHLTQRRLSTAGSSCGASRSARHHAAAQRPGGRRPLRRRPGHGDPRGRHGGGARGGLRRARRGGARQPPGGRPHPTRTPVHRTPSPASSAGVPELVLLCGRYEGFDERVHEPTGQRRDLPRPVRARRRRGRGDGGDRRRRPPPARAPSATPRASSASRSPRRSAAASSTPTTRARRSSAAGACPEVLCSGDHGAIARWRDGAARHVPVVGRLQLGLRGQACYAARSLRRSDWHAGGTPRERHREP